MRTVESTRPGIAVDGRGRGRLDSARTVTRFLRGHQAFEGTQSTARLAFGTGLGFRTGIGTGRRRDASTGAKCDPSKAKITTESERTEHAGFGLRTETGS